MSSQDDFRIEAGRRWGAAITQAFGANPPDSATWHRRGGMRAVLVPFMGLNLGRAFLPGGGGADFLSVDDAGEEGCLFCAVDDRVGEVFRPGRLQFEYFPDEPAQSFLFLDLERLPDIERVGDTATEGERIVEIAPGKYTDQAAWAEGMIGFDEQGVGIPLPEQSRLVTRWLKGKILIVCKASVWNDIDAASDGRHEAMTAERIRAAIARTLSGRSRD